jgi:hypothetical protein
MEHTRHERDQDVPNQIETKFVPPMTVERLRNHLFGPANVPFWDYDPAKLTVGVEVEYFIAQSHGATYTLAKKEQYMAVIRNLIRDHGYKERCLVDQPGRVSRDTDVGFICIKPDYAWHILEISFPPRPGTRELRPLLTSVLAEVDAALAKEGMVRLDLSCLPEPPAEMDLVKLDRLVSADTSCNQKIEGQPTTDPNFPAYVAATHIHLNTSSEESIASFPAIYETEPLTMRLYTRARSFAGCLLENARTELYANTLGRDYPLHTIPRKIPRRIEDLVEAMNAGRKLYPNDPFFPVRDMSYVRPTKYGTVEFRSACSYSSPEILLEIALWRKIQMLAASKYSESKTKMISQCLNEEILNLRDAGECSDTLQVIRSKVRDVSMGRGQGWPFRSLR